jgi:hypothetical protein
MLLGVEEEQLLDQLLVLVVLVAVVVVLHLHKG